MSIFKNKVLILFFLFFIISCTSMNEALKNDIKSLSRDDLKKIQFYITDESAVSGTTWFRCPSVRYRYVETTEDLSRETRVNKGSGRVVEEKNVVVKKNDIIIPRNTPGVFSHFDKEYPPGGGYVYDLIVIDFGKGIELKFQMQDDQTVLFSDEIYVNGRRYKYAESCGYQYAYKLAADIDQFKNENVKEEKSETEIKGKTVDS